MMYNLLIKFCWGAFLGVWLLGAVYNFLKAPKAIQHRARYDWLIYAVIAWFVIRYVPHGFRIAMFQWPWVQGFGAIVLVLSTAYTLWSRWVIGKMWAADAEVKEKHQLVTSGPYRITRHPIYTGILGMILGSMLSLGQGLIFLAFIASLFFFLARIRNEEKLMIATFRDQYMQYKKRVPGLIPGWPLKTKS